MNTHIRRGGMFKFMLYVATASAILLSVFAITQPAHAAINRSLGVGSSGSDVRELQVYLAATPSLYPEGLVTGYFGLLTQAAVQRFQTAQGIVSSGSPASTGYGRVGPITRARLNVLLGTGGVTWDTVPIISTSSVQVGNTNAVVSWVTNESTQGQLYFDTAPIRADESTGPGQTPYVSGTLMVSSSTNMQTNHTVTLSNLQSNTFYSYLIRAIDTAGGMTIILPKMFKTN